MASTTGLAELASVCQVGLHVSLSLSARLTLRCSRQPQLRPGETQRELRPAQWPHGAGPAAGPDCRHGRGSLSRPPTTSRSCLGYLELLHHTRDRLTFLSIDSGQCKRAAIVGIFKSPVDAGRRLEKAVRV